MGQITIIMNGSFGHRQMDFSAMEKGHAAAVGEAIQYLSRAELFRAIELDHKCHSEGIQPKMGYAGEIIEGLSKG